MTGVDFDRQIFVPPPGEPAKKSNLPSIGIFIFFVAICAAALVGFKLYTDYAKTRSVADSQQVEQLQSQLADMQKRINELERRRKLAPSVNNDTAAKNNATPAPRTKAARAGTTYHIAAASVVDPIPAPKDQPKQAPVARGADESQLLSALNADHEQWKATTDRLADVVGVVGTQQNQITETKEQLNVLLSETRRKAVSFELRKGSSPQPIGPVELQLKEVAQKSQRYSVCVYIGGKCIELKDRALREVVVFVTAPDTMPLELVATKILRDEIIGYLEIPEN